MVLNRILYVDWLTSSLWDERSTNRKKLASHFIRPDMYVRTSEIRLPNHYQDRLRRANSNLAAWWMVLGFTNRILALDPKVDAPQPRPLGTLPCPSPSTVEIPLTGVPHRRTQSFPSSHGQVHTRKNKDCWTLSDRLARWISGDPYIPERSEKHVSSSLTQSVLLMRIPWMRITSPSECHFWSTDNVCPGIHSAR